ncbi:oxidoreductase [Saccharibacillus sp. JS10]|uniref:oxidoreductase n=1 Tax=Saccharibacillus sp. JS10 TaxID=2950552 RepID=UPI00210A9C13|nr:oxidoreductase [Saccharibacillus sp. JS10]MCQ4085689.1 oxidoreductase [Saccharibacillus sp. JS10]
MSKRQWDGAEIADQQGRVMIVTGSSSGIGKEAVKVISSKRAKVIMAVRNVDKGKEAAIEIKKEFPQANIDVRKLDVADLDSVKAFAHSFLEDYDYLDILINNAGIMYTPYSQTADGFENQLGTNHLGHFALTGLLMPALKKTARSRIVVLSSSAHMMGKINFDDLNWEKRKYSTNQAYADSKLANLYFTYELVRKLNSEGGHPKVVAAHPGIAATDLQRHSAFLRGITKLISQHASMGALPTLRAAFDEEAKSGDFYGPSGMMNIKGYPIVHPSSKSSHDEKNAKQLWNRSEEMTGVIF